MDSKKDFYRQHTFLNKGPGRKETRTYLRNLAVFYPSNKGDNPVRKNELEKYFGAIRNARNTSA